MFQVFQQYPGVLESDDAKKIIRSYNKVISNYYCVVTMVTIILWLSWLLVTTVVTTQVTMVTTAMYCSNCVSISCYHDNISGSKGSTRVRSGVPPGMVEAD